MMWLAQGLVPWSLVLQFSMVTLVPQVRSAVALVPLVAESDPLVAESDSLAVALVVPSVLVVEMEWVPEADSEARWFRMPTRE